MAYAAVHPVFVTERSYWFFEGSLWIDLSGELSRDDVVVLALKHCHWMSSVTVELHASKEGGSHGFHWKSAEPVASRPLPPIASYVFPESKITFAYDGGHHEHLVCCQTGGASGSCESAAEVIKSENIAGPEFKPACFSSQSIDDCVLHLDLDVADGDETALNAGFDCDGMDTHAKEATTGSHLCWKSCNYAVLSCLQDAVDALLSERAALTAVGAADLLHPFLRVDYSLCTTTELSEPAKRSEHGDWEGIQLFSSPPLPVADPCTSDSNNGTPCHVPYSAFSRPATGTHVFLASDSVKEFVCPTVIRAVAPALKESDAGSVERLTVITQAAIPTIPLIVVVGAATNTDKNLRGAATVHVLSPLPVSATSLFLAVTTGVCPYESGQLDKAQVTLKTAHGKIEEIELHRVGTHSSTHDKEQKGPEACVSMEALSFDTNEDSFITQLTACFACAISEWLQQLDPADASSSLVRQNSSGGDSEVAVTVLVTCSVSPSLTILGRGVQISECGRFVVCHSSVLHCAGGGLANILRHESRAGLCEFSRLFAKSASERTRRSAYVRSEIILLGALLQSLWSVVVPDGDVAPQTLRCAVCRAWAFEIGRCCAEASSDLAQLRHYSDYIQEESLLLQHTSGETASESVAFLSFLSSSAFRMLVRLKQGPWHACTREKKAYWVGSVMYPTESRDVTQTLPAAPFTCLGPYVGIPFDTCRRFVEMLLLGDKPSIFKIRDSGAEARPDHSNEVPLVLNWNASSQFFSESLSVSVELSMVWRPLMGSAVPHSNSTVMAQVVKRLRELAVRIRLPFSLVLLLVTPPGEKACGNRVSLRRKLKRHREGAAERLGPSPGRCDLVACVHGCWTLEWSEPCEGAFLPQATRSVKISGYPLASRGSPDACLPTVFQVFVDDVERAINLSTCMTKENGNPTVQCATSPRRSASEPQKTCEEGSVEGQGKTADLKTSVSHRHGAVLVPLLAINEGEMPLLLPLVQVEYAKAFFSTHSPAIVSMVLEFLEKAAASRSTDEGHRATLASLSARLAGDRWQNEYPLRILRDPGEQSKLKARIGSRSEEVKPSLCCTGNTGRKIHREELFRGPLTVGGEWVAQFSLSVEALLSELCGYESAIALAPSGVKTVQSESGQSSPVKPLKLRRLTLRSTALNQSIGALSVHGAGGTAPSPTPTKLATNVDSLLRQLEGLLDRVANALHLSAHPLSNFDPNARPCRGFPRPISRETLMTVAEAARQLAHSVLLHAWILHPHGSLSQTKKIIAGLHGRASAMQLLDGHLLHLLV